MENFLHFIRSIGTSKLVTLCVITVLIFGGLIAIVYNITAPPMTALYGGLEVKDSNEIISELESQGIEYEIRAGGSIIMVPEDKVTRLRMIMAERGIPSKGSMIGYEIFDDGESLSSTYFSQNIKLLRALEGELGRTISSFRNVDSARVHLVLPRRELFSRQMEEPKASVLVKVRGGQTLNKEQVNAITHLVATSVPSLNPDKITIVDNKGNSLKLGGSDKDSANNVVSSYDDYKLALETRLSHSIEDLLERSLGPGRVKAEVSADVNFDKTVTNAEIYDPDGQVVRSNQAITETENSYDGSGSGNVTIETNLPNTVAESNGPGRNANSLRTNETTNFEISKTVRNQISQTGTINRLSIAVLVDGRYSTTPEGTVEYTPRDEIELQKLASLVRSAVGFDEDRNDKLEIVNMQFQQDLNDLKPESWVEWLRSEFSNLMQKLIVGIIVVLFIIMVLRPITLRTFEYVKADELELPSIDSLIKDQLDSIKEEEEKNEDDEFDMQDFEGKMKSSNSKSLNDIISKYPQESFTIIKRWLSED